MRKDNEAPNRGGLSGCFRARLKAEPTPEQSKQLFSSRWTWFRGPRPSLLYPRPPPSLNNMAIPSAQVWTFILAIFGALALVGLPFALVHLKRLWDSSRPIPSTLAWMEALEQGDLPRYIFLHGSTNDPPVHRVERSIFDLQTALKK